MRSRTEKSNPVRQSQALIRSDESGMCEVGWVCAGGQTSYLAVDKAQRGPQGDGNAWDGKETASM